MTDLDEANAILAARVAEMDAQWKGRDGFPMAYFDLKDGRHAVYVMYTANGIKEQGDRYGSLAPTAVDAAKGWAETTRVFLEGSAGILYWRRRPSIESGEAISFEQSKEWGREMSPAGWQCSARLIIVEGEIELEPADLRTMPEDYVGWDEMVAKYLAGVPPNETVL